MNKHTAESLRPFHDGMCPVSIGDGECACLVREVLRLQEENEKKQATIDDWAGIIAAHQPSSASFGPGNEPPQVTTYSYP